VNKAGIPQQHCANCKAIVTGQFCAACGQEVDVHVHSIVEFAAEALEGITHADSRLWQTLVLLLLRPGALTQEFFAGRRVRYLPPVRLYLVLSLAFFVAASFRGGAESQVAVADAEDRQQAIDQIEEQLAGATSETERLILATALEAVRRSGPAPEAPVAAEAEAPVEPCAGIDIGALGYAFDRVARILCDNYARDGGRAFGEAFLHYLPTALFLFLPLLAGVMKVLYAFSRRYYVEHLLLLVHNHAAVFLVLLLYELLAVATPSGVHPWMVLLIMVYQTWYTYRALRTVYAQERALTLIKFFALGLAYLTVGTLTLAATALYSALTL
jgi:hypothetical protein